MTPLADAALTAGSTSTPAAFSITGTGALHFTVTSSDPAVIPARIVTAGATGVSISPADCGTTTLTCSLVITPAYGGTVDLTLSVLDGARRSASATMHLSVSGDPPPPQPPPPVQLPPSEATIPAHGGGGGVLQWWAIGVLALLSARRQAAGHRGQRARPRHRDAGLEAEL